MILAKTADIISDVKSRASSKLSLLLLFLPGCSAPLRPHELLVAVDTSGSTAMEMRSYLHVLGRAASTLPVGDPRQLLVVYRYDRDCHEVHDGPRNVSPERLVLSLKESLAPSPRGGTSLARAVTALADRADRAKAPVDVLMLTDGGNDDARATAASETYRAAERLACNPLVKSFVVAGAKTGLRDALRCSLAPLAAKLRLVEVSAAADSMNEETSGESDAR